MQPQPGPNPAGRRTARAQRGRAVGRQGLFAKLMARPSLGIVAIVLIGMVALIGALIARPGAQPSAVADIAPEVGKLAPTFSLATPDGAPVSLADLRGQVVLVNFWATWCPPCRAEMPAIQAAYARYQAQGFTVVAVTANAQPTEVKGFFQSRGLQFPALLDDGHVHTAYRANGLPASFFIDRQGVVRAVYHGAMSDAVITSEVERLLGTDL